MKMNPFKFGRVVVGEDFANRRKEIEELKSEILNCSNVILFSPRRYGKTSLIKEVLKDEKIKKCIQIYCDLYGIATKKRLAETLTSSLASSTKGKLDEFISFFKRYLPAITPRITIKPGGALEIEIAIEREEDIEKTLLELFDLPQKISEEKKRRVVVVYDEFQEIARLDGRNLLKKMRSKIQYHKDVAYIFAGSQKHLFEDLFVSEEGPFFNFGKFIRLEKIPEEEFSLFITRKFMDTGIEIEQKVVSCILNITQGHPSYTQQLCHEVWNIALPKKRAEEKDVILAVENVISSQSYAYEIVWDSLTAKQKALLIALSKEEAPSIFSERFRKKYSLGSVGGVQRAVKVLEDKEIIERAGGRIEIKDVFMREWLRNFLR